MSLQLALLGVKLHWPCMQQYSLTPCTIQCARALSSNHAMPERTCLAIKPQAKSHIIRDANNTYTGHDHCSSVVSPSHTFWHCPLKQVNFDVQVIGVFRHPDVSMHVSVVLSRGRKFGANHLSSRYTPCMQIFIDARPTHTHSGCQSKTCVSGASPVYTPWVLVVAVQGRRYTLTSGRIA